MNPDKITVQFTDVSQRTAALVAGLGLLLMAVLAPIANFYVLQNLVVANDAKITVDNILARGGLFRIGIVCLLVVAWFRVAYAAVFAVALIPL